MFSHNQSSILAGAARTDARDNTKSGGYFLSAVERESLDFDSPIRNACDHPTAPRLGGDAAASAARPGNVDPILVFAGGYTQRSLNRAHPGGHSAVRMNLRPYPQLITETGDGLSIASLPLPWSNAAGASYLVWMCKPWGEKALINALKGTRTPFGAITRRIWLARAHSGAGFSWQRSVQAFEGLPTRLGTRSGALPGLQHNQGWRLQPIRLSRQPDPCMRHASIHGLDTKLGGMFTMFAPFSALRRVKPLTDFKSHRIERRTMAAALAVIALGVWLRVAGLGREGFWLDEIYSASLANLSAVGTLLGVLHFDVHPPLYYLQLNLWERFGHGDFWLLLNSVFWSTATLIAVFVGASREFGCRSGLLALTFCAVMGSEIYFADELRMYALVGCLAVLCWIAANRLRAQFRLRNALPLIVTMALLAAVHAAALIPASAVMLYIFPDTNARDLKRHLPTWLGIATLVAMAYLPWVVLASIHHVEHAASPSLEAFSHTVGGWILGYGNALGPTWVSLAAAVLVAVGLAAAMLTMPQLSRLVACFVIWPLLFGAFLCLAVQPIWLDRTFAFCAPFIAIAFGAALGHASSPRGTSLRSYRPYALGVALALWVLVSAWVAHVQVTTPYKPDQYRESAAYLNQHAKPGEIVFAPDDPDFWGIARYLIGPNWGSILAVEDIADKHRKFRLMNWLETHAHVSGSRLKALGLAPVTRELDNYHRMLFIGNSPLPQASSPTVVWLVTRDGSDLADLPLCTNVLPEPSRFGRVQLYRIQCDGATPRLNVSNE